MEEWTKSSCGRAAATSAISRRRKITELSEEAALEVDQGVPAEVMELNRDSLGRALGVP